ncbi:carbon storage regulator [uncultured Pseudomonas sp.]|uniref:carbon storage regulator n=1 Tax=uncultured Pseudomonas sp. TaxID=114707 RepID=UPI0025F679D8|nr:carbon storage regulator [uncultured Pseudomonas sp.]
MALTLTRRAGDEILLRLEADISEGELQQLITKGLRIRVMRIEEGQTALSIDAPKSVSIMRTELLPT